MLATAVTVGAACGFEMSIAAKAQAAKPNVVFILGDNVGYGVLSSYNGGALDTPTSRIDRLAGEGLRLTNFNVENQCTPSRAAFMTGRLPIRSGIGKAIAAGAPVTKPGTPANAVMKFASTPVNEPLVPLLRMAERIVLARTQEF